MNTQTPKGQPAPESSIYAAIKAQLVEAQEEERESFKERRRLQEEFLNADVTWERALQRIEELHRRMRRATE